MGARLLDGKVTAAAIRSELRDRVALLAADEVTLGLGTILVGDDPGSHAYVAGKHRDSKEIGITSLRRDLPADASQADVENAVRELNDDPKCTAFLVQLPLPAHLDAQRILELVDPAKDADGLHPVNLGRLVLGYPGPLPATPRGTVELLRRHDISFPGAEVVIVGRGLTVGRPLGLLLTRRTENATVTLCHTGTRDLADHTKAADILIAAAGVPGLIQPDMVRPGAVVVDIGITRTERGLVGDVAPEVAQIAAWLAPVPGGVGPMTRAMLLTNVVDTAEHARAHVTA